MPARIEVVNWGRFQHYKNRNPPWIKLHRALLDNREWAALSGDASKLLAECWLLASEYDDGAIPMDARDLAWRLRRPDAAQVARLLQELAAHGFVRLAEQDASTALAGCKQDATPETEVETETEVENTPPKGGGADAPKVEDPAEAAEHAWNVNRPRIAGLVRKVAWLDGPAPHYKTRSGKRWGMDNEMSIAKQLLKQFTPDELCGGIEHYRETHNLGPDEPFSLALVYAEGERWRISLAVEAWRQKLLDAGDPEQEARIHSLLAKIGGDRAA